MPDWVTIGWAVILTGGLVVVLILLALAALPDADRRIDDANARAETALRADPGWVPLSIREEPSPGFGRIAWANGAGYDETRRVAIEARKLANELAWVRGESPNRQADDAVADLLRGVPEPVRRYGVDLAGVDVSGLGMLELLDTARQHSPVRWGLDV